MSEAKKTTDHEEIRRWAESRQAKPARVTGTERSGSNTGIIRLNFPGYKEESLEEIGWDEWFQQFDRQKLALLYQDETKDGEKSNFNKIVERG